MVKLGKTCNCEDSALAALRNANQLETLVSALIIQSYHILRDNACYIQCDLY